MSGFPENVIPELETALVDNMGNWELPNGTQLPVTIIKRPLVPTDPNRSVGIFSVDWTPVTSSMEIGRRIPGEPTLSRYNYRIQSFTKHTDREEASRISGYDTKVIRAILYRDPALRLRLTALSDTVLGARERLQRYGIARQRFIQNDLSGTFVAFSSTDFWIETESIDPQG